MKEEIAKLETWGDASDYFKAIHIAKLKQFIEALTDANKFIELTMRDNFLLGVANSELVRRIG